VPALDQLYFCLSYDRISFHTEIIIRFDIVDIIYSIYIFLQTLQYIYFFQTTDTSISIGVKPLINFFKVFYQICVFFEATWPLYPKFNLSKTICFLKRT
jgi:hypothetical protein